MDTPEEGRTGFGTLPCPECRRNVDLSGVVDDFDCPWCGAGLSTSGILRRPNPSADAGISLDKWLHQERERRPRGLPFLRGRRAEPPSHAQSEGHSQPTGPQGRRGRAGDVAEVGEAWSRVVKNRGGRA